MMCWCCCCCWRMLYSDINMYWQHQHHTSVLHTRTRTFTHNHALTNKKTNKITQMANINFACSLLTLWLIYYFVSLFIIHLSTRPFSPTACLPSHFRSLHFFFISFHCKDESKPTEQWNEVAWWEWKRELKEHKPESAKREREKASAGDGRWKENEWWRHGHGNGANKNDIHTNTHTHTDTEGRCCVLCAVAMMMNVMTMNRKIN